MKNSLIYLLIAFLFLSGCFPFKAIFLGGPDMKDAQRMNKNTVKALTDAKPLSKSNNYNEQDILVNDWTSRVPVFKPLRQMLEGKNTRAAVILHKGQIVYEDYFEGETISSTHTSFSVAKSFTSVLCGIAIDEGFIKSVEEPVTNYLPELVEIDGQFRKVKIKHLLNQTSGIAPSTKSLANMYYGKDLWKGIKMSKFEAEPGTVQNYINVTVQLLGMIIEKATATPLHIYLQNKIWQPLEMENDAFWNADGKGKTQGYCCLNATARDYAKFGLLMLNKGNWQGKQIVSETWVNKTLSRNTDEGSSYNYNYLWHIGLKEYGDFMADGLFKQYIYVCPKKDLVIAVFNNKEGYLEAERTMWRNVFRQIADQF